MSRWIGAMAAVAVLAALAMSGGAAPVTAAGDTRTAIFAGGCFWCVEAAFDEVGGVTENGLWLRRRHQAEPDLRRP